MGWLKNIFSPEKAATMALRSGEDVIQFYQQLGFFAGSNAADVLLRYRQEFGQSFSPAKPWDDVFLLSLSKEKVWASDPEADVCNENEVYTEVLQEWAAISSGAFSPAQIQEKWEGEAGPVTISFRLGEDLVNIRPEYFDDWLDLDVLRQINRHIAEKQFAYAVDGNFCLVLCLTDQQKEQMRHGRQFPFAW